MKALRIYGGKLTKEESQSVLKSFPGQEGGNKGARLNIARLFDQQYNNVLQGMYNKVDVENTVGTDEPTDLNGFLGYNQYYRKEVGPLKPITEAQFLAHIYKENKLKEITLSIKEIDKDHNGYVTRQELDDIIKVHYEA